MGDDADGFSRVTDDTCVSGTERVFVAVRLTDKALEAAQVIYDFHFMRQNPVAADVIIALGTNDLRVAEFASGLFHEGFGKWLVCTGGTAHQGDLLETTWDRTEAEMYREVAIQRGVPSGQILLETQATNTAENIRFSRRVLVERGVPARNIVIAVKPFMQRRAAATIAVEWPEIPFSLASPPLSLQEYFTAELPAERILHILMGDLQRIWIYGRRGWSAPQRMPGEVMDAYRFLKSEGWTQHLIEDSEEDPH